MDRPKGETQHGHAHRHHALFSRRNRCSRRLLCDEAREITRHLFPLFKARDPRAAALQMLGVLRSFRCPHTGLNVQGHTEDDGDRGVTFEAITCTACGGVHLVDPKPGRVG